jgi:phosphoglycerol transferase
VDKALARAPITQPDPLPLPTEPERPVFEHIKQASIKALPYLLAVLLGLFIPNLLLDFGSANLAVPFEYSSSSDAIGILAVVKNTDESGWYLRNNRLGAPGYQDFSDYPQSAAAHLVVIEILSKIVGDPLRAVNLYFILSFPLICVTTLYVLRSFGLWWPAALAAGLLYACLPFRFLRSTHHLFLSVYYIIPLACGIALSLTRSTESLPFAKMTADGRSRICRRSIGIAAAILIWTASTDVYYAVFTGFFVAIAALVGWGVSRDRRRLLIAAGMIALLVTTLAIQLAPSVFPKDGRNPAAVVRDPSGAEVLGLKITQLLLPISDHRLPRLADLKRLYNSYSVARNENDHVTLGLLGAIGFLSLVGRVLISRGGSDSLLDSAGKLNLAAVLLATIGGFGAISGLLFTAKIRGFNRIVVYIAFFSLMAFVCGFDWLKRRYAHVRWSEPVLVALLCLITALGLLDQFSPAWALDYQGSQKKFAIDDQFVKAIEARVPDGAMVFQLPFVSFPEQPAVYHMAYIEHLTAYLHSKKIHWSFGAMRGRWPDAWQRTVAGMDPAQMAAVVALRGFSGVYLDRFGYLDRAQTLDPQLRAITGMEPIVSSDDRKLYYSLDSYKNNVLAAVGSAHLDRARVATSDPILVEWGKGAWTREADPTNSWHWCDRRSISS